MTLRAVLSGLLALATAGCVAGPDYRLPARSTAASPAAGQPFSAADEAVFAQTPPPDHWWKLYGDARLDALIEEAMTANRDLRAADANLRRAALVVRETQAGRQVMAEVSGAPFYGRPLATPYDLPGVLGYDVGASAGVPLDLSGRIRRAIEAAVADSEATAAARDDVRVTVAAAVTRAYANVCAANFQLGVNRRVVALQRQALDITQRLLRGGRGTSFDVTRARAAVDSSAATLPGFAAERQANLFLIATLMGRLPADYPREIEQCAAIPAIAAPLPVGDGAALIRRRPDIRAAERRLAADTARIGVATAELYPQVSFGGSLELSGPFDKIGSANSLGFSFGPLLSWTFPNRSVARVRIAEAGAQADADLAQFDSAVLGALRETETALSGYARGIDQVAALAKARDSAARATDQANRLFRYGRTDFLPLLDAQQNLAGAEAALASAQARLINRQIDIFLALGGGWQAEDSPAPAAGTP